MPESRNSDVRVALCTCPDEETARRLAAGMVEARLAACVNIMPGIRSVFRWQGQVQDEGEVLMVIKTIAGRAPKLESWLLAHHPYDVPEFLVLPVAGGSSAYLEWVAQESC